MSGTYQQLRMEDDVDDGSGLKFAKLSRDKVSWRKRRNVSCMLLSPSAKFVFSITSFYLVCVTYFDKL